MEAKEEGTVAQYVKKKKQVSNNESSRPGAKYRLKTKPVFHLSQL